MMPLIVTTMEVIKNTMAMIRTKIEEKNNGNEDAIEGKKKKNCINP